MRKLEGIVKEVVDEMTYLRKREERFTKTNGAFIPPPHFMSILTRSRCPHRIDESTRTKLWLVYHPIACWLGRMANIPPSRVLQAEISYRLILFLLVGGMLILPLCACYCCWNRLYLTPPTPWRSSVPMMHIGWVHPECYAKDFSSLL